MKRLAASVVLLGLIGCPNWDDERVKQCRKINANTGVCVGLDGGAGGGSAGGGTGGGVAGGSGGGTSGDLGDGGVNALPVFPASQVLKTYVDGNHLRRPAFLWEVPGTGALMAVETRETDRRLPARWRQ